MHNLAKIKLFRIACRITYLPALLFIYPLAFFKKKNKTGLFFLFDRYSIGGAQRIHLDILESVEDIPKQVYFTRKSVNQSFRQAFFNFPNTVSKDIHFWCDFIFFRVFTIHFYAFYLNRHSNARVLSSNSTFFYDLLPFLKKETITIELLHNFTFGKNGMEFFGLANHHYLTYRFVYDTYTLNNIRQQYDSYKIPDSYLDRILFFEPGVKMPPTLLKDYSFPLNILYAGRGGPQKRIHLLNKIAEHCLQQNWPVRFHFAGTVIDELSEIVKEKSILHGNISSPDKMNELYQQSHAILMTSAYEGFPMLIKESMAYGCVPIVTALEGNKMHLKDGMNALLINAADDEEKVINEGTGKIQQLINDQELLRKLSVEAHLYAMKYFDKRKFLKECRELLMNAQ
jgi:glycosyltransferase involved in cell wall biosynthesis